MAGNPIERRLAIPGVTWSILNSSKDRLLRFDLIIPGPVRGRRTFMQDRVFADLAIPLNSIRVVRPKPGNGGLDCFPDRRRRVLTH